jgi:hypothetical protein
MPLTAVSKIIDVQAKLKLATILQKSYLCALHEY